MDTNKMREQFEAWVKSKWPDTYMERIPFGEGRSLEGNYWEVNVQMLWSSWQASRDAVLVELPDTEWFGDSWSGGWAIAREGVVDAIEGAGLKVAP